MITKLTYKASKIENDSCTDVTFNPMPSVDGLDLIQDEDVVSFDGKGIDKLRELLTCDDEYSKVLGLLEDFVLKDIGGSYSNKLDYWTQYCKDNNILTSTNKEPVFITPFHQKIFDVIDRTSKTSIVGEYIELCRQVYYEGVDYGINAPNPDAEWGFCDFINKYNNQQP